MELVRKARNAEMPKSFWSEPLVYQGGSDTFLDPMEPIQIAEEAWGIDFEAEVAVIVDMFQWESRKKKLVNTFNYC